MTAVHNYTQELCELGNPAAWMEYILKRSGLPGPRGNLELAYAVADAASEPIAEALVASDEICPAENTPEMFVVFCGVVWMGKNSDYHPKYRVIVRKYASDSRWRMREAVPIGLQLWGRQHLNSLMDELDTWVDGNFYEQRALAASLCEPALLKSKLVAIQVLQLLDKITHHIHMSSDRSDESARVLIQGLSYCWSVAAAAHLEEGKILLEKWMRVDDPIIKRIMKENLKKNRLVRLDPVWTADWAVRLSGTN